MAVAPLYVVDMDQLKLELRLQGLRTEGEGEAILIRMTSAARVYIFQQLGISTALAFAAESDVDDPETEAEVKRKACTLLEIEYIRCRLLEVMPVMTADSSGDAQETYNNEGVWRQVSPEERDEILARCNERILELLSVIRGDAGLGDPEALNSWDGTRTSQRKRATCRTRLELM